MQPTLRISHSLPTKPSEVQTMLNGRGYSTASAILRSRKHEWFIRTRQGSSLLICAMPIFSQWKCVAKRSGAEATRRTVRNSSDGFFGFLCTCGGWARTCS